MRIISARRENRMFERCGKRKRFRTEGSRSADGLRQLIVDAVSDGVVDPDEMVEALVKAMDQDQLDFVIRMMELDPEED